jgi:phosphoglycerate-specific signal transduction histidine kinase
MDREYAELLLQQIVQQRDGAANAAAEATTKMILLDRKLAEAQKQIEKLHEEVSKLTLPASTAVDAEQRAADAAYRRGPKSGL